MYYLIGSAILFAAVFAVHAVLFAVANALHRLTLTSLNGLRPAVRARVLLGLNLAPLGGALVCAGMLLTSFILFEPRHTNEGIGWLLGTGAFLGIAGLVWASGKALMVGRATRSLVSNWEHNAAPIAIPGWTKPAFRLPHAFPLIAVVGIWRPRLFVAAKVIDHLDAGELAAALAHEVGHLLARDNFKRVLINFVEAMAWWMPGANRLRVSWADAAELAADEFASASSSAEPLNLAAALVKLARLTPAGARPAMPAGAFLVEAAGDILTRRVSWLVRLEPVDKIDRRRMTNVMVAGVMFVIALIVLIGIRFDLLGQIHQLTEFMVR